MSLRIYSNPEKDNVHRTITDEKKFKFSKPQKILIIGASGCGKSNLIKNLIVNNDGYDIIYIMHANPLATEYDDIPHIKYEIDESDDYINRFMAFPDKDKLLIIDDINFSTMSRKSQANMYKLITYVSARGVSIISTSQDPTYYTPMIRRAFEVLIFYAFYNKDSLNVLSKYTSPILSYDDIITTINNYFKSKYDFIIVNKQNNTAWVCVGGKVKLLRE